MRAMRVLMLMTVAPALLTGCMSFFYADKPKQEASAAGSPSGKLNTECARLQPLFKSDGSELTREQMDAALKLELQKWDKDGSGDLTNSEVQPLNDELRAENVGASPVRDWNADGRIDEKEFGSGWRTMFELCDRNRNNMVSVRELGHSPNVTAPRTAPSETKKKPEGSSGDPQRPQAPGY
jgi:hypothetical protein